MKYPNILKTIIAIIVLFITLKLTWCREYPKPKHIHKSYIVQTEVLITELSVCKYGIRSAACRIDGNWIRVSDQGSGYYYKRYSIKAGDTVCLPVEIVETYDTSNAQIKLICVQGFCNLNKFHIN